MRCEYNNCNKPAYKKFLGLTWYCKKHYLIILDNFISLNAGRPRKIKLERIFNWLEKKNGYITLKEFMQEFLVTYPTANFYLDLLEKEGFLKKNRTVWEKVKEMF